MIEDDLQLMFDLAIGITNTVVNDASILCVKWEQWAYPTAPIKSQEVFYR